MRAEPVTADLKDVFEEFHTGTEGRAASTTMVFVRMLSKLLRAVRAPKADEFTAQRPVD